MYPRDCNSSQFASNSFGPMRKFKSAILSSSLRSVAVNPSLQWDWTIVKTRLNIFAGMVCTSRGEKVCYRYSRVLLVRTSYLHLYSTNLIHIKVAHPTENSIGFSFTPYLLPVFIPSKNEMSRVLFSPFTTTGGVLHTFIRRSTLFMIKILNDTKTHLLANN